MPTMTVAECPKDVLCKDDLVGWVKRPEQKVERAKEIYDEMWSRSPRAAIAPEKHSAYRWALRVREQYGPAKRTLRYFRYHHRSRLENVADRLFYQEAARWKDDTMHWSSVTKMIAHPSYLRIIGLGNQFKQGEIERLILKELENDPDHWFEALAAITGDNPVGPNDDFDAAVNAWLAWGHQKGLLG